MKKSLALILALVLALSCAIAFKHCAYKREENQSFVKYTDSLYLISDAKADYAEAESVLGDASYYNKFLGSVITTDLFAGVNFDYSEDLVSYVVLNKATDKTLASVGVVGFAFDPVPVFSSYMPAISNDGLSCFTTSGINEKGVFCAITRVSDVVPECTATNPEAKTSVSFLFAVRYLLDNAESLVGAIELLQNTNWYLPEKIEASYHLLVADNTKAYVIELNEKGLVLAEDEFVATNFYLSATESDIAQGKERYSTLSDTRELISSRWGMMKTMASVYYTEAYNSEAKSFWNSEFYGTYQDAEGNDYTLNAKSEASLFETVIQEKAAAFAEDSTGFFRTVSSAVYDYATGTLCIRTNEGPLELQFSLNLEPPVEESEEESEDEYSFEEESYVPKE